MTPASDSRPDPDPGVDLPETSDTPDGGGEPNTEGTVFIMILFLMALAGMWGIMYLTLLER